LSQPRVTAGDATPRAPWLPGWARPPCGRGSPGRGWGGAPERHRGLGQELRQWRQAVAVLGAASRPVGVPHGRRRFDVWAVGDDGTGRGLSGRGWARDPRQIRAPVGRYQCAGSLESAAARLSRSRQRRQAGTRPRWPSAVRAYGGPVRMWAANISSTARCRSRSFAPLGQPASTALVETSEFTATAVRMRSCTAACMVVTLRACPWGMGSTGLLSAMAGRHGRGTQKTAFVLVWVMRSPDCGLARDYRCTMACKPGRPAGCARATPSCCTGSPLTAGATACAKHGAATRRQRGDASMGTT
jgi:hypothetical protein